MIHEGMNSPAMTPPVGPFSHLVRADELLFLSGQTAQDPVSGKLIAGDVSAQATQIFANIATVLATVGADLSHVLKATVYLTDMQDFAALNAVYAAHFTAPYPARTTIAVVALPLGARVEIEVIARLP